MDVPVWHFEVNFRILVCQLVIYIYMCYVYVICVMYMHYVYVLYICILYSVYVLCNVNKKRGNNIFNNNGVLVARGGRESSNPAKTTTHLGTVEKETHFMNVVGTNDKKSIHDFMLQSRNLEYVLP